MRPARFLFGIAAASVAFPASAQFALHNGDRVVFYGDSITDNSPYTQFVETFVVTRYPKMNVRFFNAGVGGDRVGGGWMGPIDQRLPRDLFSRKPTVVTVMLGMNDGGYRALDSGLFDTYQKGYRHILDRVKAEAPSARMWLIQPSPYDDFTHPVGFAGGYNGVLKTYGAFVGDLAKERQLGLIDLNTPVADALTRAAAADSALAQKIVPDRVHPGPAGHLVMAAAIVKAWGAPSMISRVEIDAAGGKTNAAGATVRDLRTGTNLAWSETEDALPFPIDRRDPVTQLLLRTSPVEDTLGREIVVVRNLAPGNYTLKIDGKDVASYPAEQWAQGVDLSWLATPMLQQAFRVHALTQQRTQMRYSAWRQIEFALQDVDVRSKADALKAIDRLDEDLVKRQHAEAKPVAHRFELVKG